MNKLRKQLGATLMEILITMVIMLFGMVGLSQLFIKAQRTTAEAYDRHRALALANQMAEITRSMMRGVDTKGALSTAPDRCPTEGAMPSNGILTNEQIMSCFDALSKPGANRALGRFSGETTISAPEKTKAQLLNCTRPVGCNNRDMVLYVLNNWTESLAGYSQAVPTPAAGQVFSNRNFAARGCIDRICDVTGRKTGCTGSKLNNMYRVRVYWQTIEPITQDESVNYCDEANVSEYWRYTFVDISIPTPSSVPSRAYPSS